VLLLLDDLQWADDLTLGWLRFVLRGRLLENVRMLIVAAFRSEEVGDALGPLLQAPELRQLELSRLDESAVGSMVGDMLAVVPPPAVFVHYLSKHSEGNPFFVAEYLRAAVEDGLLYRMLSEAGRSPRRVRPMPQRRRTRRYRFPARFEISSVNAS
jgi:predicted ATPase